MIQTPIKLSGSNIAKKQLQQLVSIQDQGIKVYEWLEIQDVMIEPKIQQELGYLVDRLLNYDTHLMNEATIWSRAIYPLLSLAEIGNIQAWAEVNLKATYPSFTIEAIADGVLGRSTSGTLESPYLVVVEAKRGLEAENPVYQLYLQFLAAAWLNWQQIPLEPQIIFGAYTIADTWKLMKAEVEGFESDRPRLTLEASREFSEKLEAEIILKILNKIVRQYLVQSDQMPKATNT